MPPLLFLPRFAVQPLLIGLPPTKRPPIRQVLGEQPAVNQRLLKPHTLKQHRLAHLQFKQVRVKVKSC